MNTFVDEILNQISYEKRSIGDIIDDRSMNRIPLHAYAVEYAKWDAVEKMIRTTFELTK